MSSRPLAEARVKQRIAFAVSCSRASVQGWPSSCASDARLRRSLAASVRPRVASRRRRARGIELRADAASHLERARAEPVARANVRAPGDGEPNGRTSDFGWRGGRRKRGDAFGAQFDSGDRQGCDHLGVLSRRRRPALRSAAAILLWRRGARRGGITRRLAQCPGSVYAMLARCPGPPSALTAAAPAFGKPGSSARPGVELSVTSPKVAMV